MEKNVVPILYHGTDARLISMPKESRLQYLNEVNKAIDYLWTIYKPSYFTMIKYDIHLPDGSIGFSYKKEFENYKNLFQEKGLTNLYINIYEKLSMLESRDNGAGLYQYGHLYLCASKDSAIRYAYRSFAGGELGLIAYRLIEGLDVIKFPEWKPSKEICSIIEKIKDFSKDEARDPVVISIENVDVGDLLMEDGRKIDNSLINRMSKRQYDFKFRYLRDVQLDLVHAEHLLQNK